MVYDLTYKLSIKSVSIYMDEKIDILDFAKHNYGCVIRNVGKFRCTYYDNDITMNMYNSGSFIVFTHSLSDEELKERIFKIFKIHYRSAKISNMLIRFKFPSDRLILEELEKRLTFTSIDDMFMNRPKEKHDQECFIENGMTKCCVYRYDMDKQKFSSLRITPWKDSKIKIIVFNSGKINCPGLKTEEDKTLTVEFMKNMLYPVLNECILPVDDSVIDFESLL